MLFLLAFTIKEVGVPKIHLACVSPRFGFVETTKNEAKGLTVNATRMVGQASGLFLATYS